MELRSFLIQSGLLYDLVKEFPALSELQNYEEVVRSIDDLKTS